MVLNAQKKGSPNRAFFAWAYELLGVTAPEERELIAEEALYLLY